jgi:predicted phage terminase large subunit-like protein
VADVDLPRLDEEITQLPTDIRESLAQRGRSSLYFFSKAVLGYNKMNPHTHGGMCEFHDRNPAQYKETLMPRGTFKSSVKTIGGGLQRICKDREERVLITNENDGNAQRFLYAIKTHAESNKVFRALYSDLIPPDTKKVRWNNEVLDFQRNGKYPEASITGRGITSALTSQHYTHMILDDLISMNAIKSPAVMADTIERAHQVLSLSVDPSRSTWELVGTRWGFADLYSDFEKKYGTKMARYIRGANEFDSGLLFPELLGHEQLAQLRISYGPYLYSCLYQNNPRNEDVQDFNVQDLRYWRWDSKEENVILYDSLGSIKEIVPLEDLDISVTVDLAGAEKVVDDRNAISCVGVTPAGDVVVLDNWARRCSPIDVMNHLIDLAKRYNVRIWGIEDIAYQKAFKYFLKAECNRLGLYMHVKPLPARGKKETRIRGLQPVLATGHLYVHPTQGILQDEMADFPLGEHDDALESLSMQLQVMPQRVGPEFWAKYKASEEKLLSRIEGYGLKALPKRDPEEVDPEDEQYDNPPTWRDYVLDPMAL